MPARTVILDIETTSLEADAGTLVSAGLMSDKGRGEYLDAKRTSDEKSLLLKLLKRLESYDVMVTWNGRSFDVPFLTTRLMKHSVDPRPILRMSHTYTFERLRGMRKLQRQYGSTALTICGRHGRFS